ncbi:MAG: hypothetical protein J0L84_13960 [Verrucomicrobia bacterium]|nr:hypothetical protein [Verrucomicrobiota bacterium]
MKSRRAIKIVNIDKLTRKNFKGDFIVHMTDAQWKRACAGGAPPKKSAVRQSRVEIEFFGLPGTGGGLVLGYYVDKTGARQSTFPVVDIIGGKPTVMFLRRQPDREVGCETQIIDGTVSCYKSGCRMNCKKFNKKGSTAQMCLCSELAEY